MSSVSSTATLRAIAVHPGTPDSLHRTTLPATEPLPGQALVDVIRVGVCGTDREIIRGELGIAPKGTEELVIGHEVLGRVRRVGADVTRVREGQLVTGIVRRPDGCPYCQAGYPDMCVWHQYHERGIFHAHGFMTEQIVDDEAFLVPIPDHLEPIGVLTEPLTVVEKAVRQARLIQNRLPFWPIRTAVVLGAGPIGLLGTLLLRSLDVDVYTVARRPGSSPVTRILDGCGATYVPTQETPLADLARQIPPIDLMIESSGSVEVAFESMQYLGPNGVEVLLSLTGGHRTIEIPASTLNTSLVAGNRTVVGSVNAGIEDFTNAVASLDRFEHLWPGLTESLITDRLTLDSDLALISSKTTDGIKSVIEIAQP